VWYRDLGPCRHTHAQVIRHVCLGFSGKVRQSMVFAKIRYINPKPYMLTPNHSFQMSKSDSLTLVKTELTIKDIMSVAPQITLCIIPFETSRAEQWNNFIGYIKSYRITQKLLKNTQTNTDSMYSHVMSDQLMRRSANGM
jgi:hypothetical protein